MQKLKVPKAIKSAAASFVAAKEESRDLTNETNRIKTVLRNAIKTYWIENNLPIGSYLRVIGSEFRYEAAESTSYDTAAILKLYEDKEITRDQFLRLIKIDPKQLGNVLGADLAADLTVVELGATLDIRIKDLLVEHEDDEFIMVERSIRKKRKRSVFGRRAEAKLQATRPKRRIRTRTSK